MLVKSVRYLVGLVAVFFCLASYADPASVPLKTNAFGYLTTLDGAIVFTCNKDVPKSATRTCLVDPDPTFTPLLATDQDHAGGYFAIAKLDDGQLHWTYRGRPVYVAAGPAPKKSPWKRPGYKALWREH